MPNVTLIEPEHRYEVDGHPCLDSVTGVLKRAGFTYYNSDPWYMERGRAVHRATHLIDLDDLDWDTVDPRILGYLHGYVKFKAESGMTFEHIEEPMYHPIYDYCGTPDRWNNDEVYDIKTGEESELQLGGYGELISAKTNRMPRRAFTIKLNEDGTYSLKPTKEQVRYLAQVFLSFLITNRWKENHGNNA